MEKTFFENVLAKTTKIHHTQISQPSSSLKMFSSPCSSMAKMSASQRRQERKRRYEEFSETETDSSYDSSDSARDDDSEDHSTREVALILAQLKDQSPAPALAAPSVPEVKPKKQTCTVCGSNSSSAGCVKIILDEMQAEFRPTGDKFVEMAEVVLRSRKSRNIITPGPEAEPGSVASAMAFKMNQHRMDRSTLLGRLVFAMLRSAVAAYRRVRLLTSKANCVRLDFVRSELHISDAVLPAFYLKENSARVNDMAIILDAFTLYKPEHLCIPAIFPRKKY